MQVLQQQWWAESQMILLELSKDQHFKTNALCDTEPQLNVSL